MPTSSWDQKRAQIATALQGSGGPGWGGFAQSVGAGIGANPLLRWGPQGQAAPEMAGGAGLMGQAGGGGQMARMAQMPGFNYVPPPTGPAPVATPAAGAGGAWTADDRMAFLRGRQTPANAMAYTQALGQGAYDYNRQGRGGGGYTTSGRGGGRSSSFGGAQRGGGGLY